MNNSFFRKISFGLSLNDHFPADPLQWAYNQLDLVPEFSWQGNIPTEKEMRANHRNRIYKDRKILRKKYKNDKKKYESEKQKLRIKTGQHFYESNELTIRHNEAINGKFPVFERFWHFWGNHFAISEKDFLPQYATGPYQREIIRPNMINTFEDLVREVTISWAMINHLDNSNSVGPRSKYGIRSRETINENHARELLELHTVSPAAGYNQNDVIQMTNIMTGWQYKWSKTNLETGDVWFNYEHHEPLSKTILGKTYKANGKHELFAVIKDLVNTSICKKFISIKLCRHFITDFPTEEMVAPVVKAWEDSNGSLPEIHKAVIKSAFDFAGSTKKFQNPEIWTLQLARMFGFSWIPRPDTMNYNFKTEPTESQTRIESALKEMGHLPYRPQQPNGWSDFEEDWISPELLIRRLIFAKKISAYGIKRDKLFYDVIKRNFDNPDKIINLTKVHDEKVFGNNIFANKFSIFANSSEMLKS
jgi:uncharacterized protein (DUF1800 family)